MALTTVDLDGPRISAESAPAAGARSDEGVIRWFDQMYADAAGDPTRLPWARASATPALVAWLNHVAPDVIRPGARVVVVGCGLGHDVVEVENRGYDVVGFDVCESAIEWARRLHPPHQSRFVVGDACDPPARLRRRFDLAVDVHTLQSVPPSMRETMARGMSELLCPHGALLSISHGRDESVPLETIEGPPFPFTPEELTATMRAAGLIPTSPMNVWEDEDGEPDGHPVTRLRAAFSRG